MDQLIKEYITLPLAIKAMQHDRELFKGYSMINVYWSKIDHVLAQMQQDHNEVKRQLISKYKVQVKAYKNDNNRVYVAGNKSFEFTGEQLRDMTKDIISRYMYGDRATDFEDRWYPEYSLGKFEPPQV